QVDGFDLVSPRIEALMPVVMRCARAGLGAWALRAVHFHAAQRPDAEPLVTLVYADDLGDGGAWRAAAAALRAAARSELGEAIHVTGRCKGKTLHFDHDFVLEQLTLEDGRALLYEQPEGSFSHPNARANEQTLSWLCRRAQIISGQGGEAKNLLELYCGDAPGRSNAGCGNHTAALQKYFCEIVAVDVDGRLTAAALRNVARNRPSGANESVHVVTSDSARACGRILRQKRWRVAGTPHKIAFDAVLVDPPRCGIDPATLRLLDAYEDVLYVSCNPTALRNDLEKLAETHDIAAFCALDAFPSTPHLECLVHLVRRKHADADEGAADAGDGAPHTRDGAVSLWEAAYAWLFPAAPPTEPE
ncbi:hypothetical protein M885DRAFT_448966, partial [Pelagophyceae sp. CCMP2097]